MRFTIKKNEFLKTLLVVSKPVPSKSFVPSLIFIKIILDDRGLNLIGSNETFAISSTIPFSYNDNDIIRNYHNGAILVQGHYLVEIVRKLSGDEVTLDVLDNNLVQITDGKSDFKVNAADVNEYPDIDFNEDGTSFNVNKNNFISLIEQTSFAASNKVDSVLSAVNLTGQNNVLTALALDAARLSQKKISIDQDVDFSANVPAKTLNDIIRLFDDSSDINIVVNERKIFFKFNLTIISANLLNAEYPNVKNIIKDNFNFILEVNAHEILSAIDRVSLVTNDNSTIRLVMNSDEVEVSSTTNEVGNAAEKINTFQYNGSRLEILFNSGFALDAIRALKCEDVMLCFDNEMRPFVIKNPQDESVIELITPVRL